MHGVRTHRPVILAVAAAVCLTLTTACTSGSHAPNQQTSVDSLLPQPSESILPPTNPPPSSPIASATSATSAAPTATPTARPTPTIATTGPNTRPGEKPPVLAPAGRTNTPNGADLFARYWYAALDWGYSTTDSTLADTLFAPSCTRCAETTQHVFDDTRRKHDHFVGGRIIVTDTNPSAGDGHFGASMIVDVTADQVAFKIVSSTGVTVQTDQASLNVTFRTWLEWSDQGWSVVDWERAVVK